MLFNSFGFGIFLVLVFLIYWFVVNKNLKLQNAFILIASYIFYGWWDWRFLILIAFTSIASYYSGILLERSDRSEKRRKLISATNIVINLLILGFFKYFNFFGESFAELFRCFGYEMNFVTLKIILPVGISFYTFQALSYTIDVYRRKVKPTKDPVAFMAYISFFPLLVAGPIERATNLLPQFYVKRQFDYASAVNGARQILWGFFKKILVADNCAAVANDIFNNYETFGGLTLLLGALMFTFQIYCDFSGYSDIAIGTARLFGFNAMKNFNYPYFSRDIAEFWRRWHISLTTWFRDYIYIPLGGSRGTKWMSFRNTLIVFLVSGFWHGANWTFLAWGLYHALLFLPLLLSGQNRKFVGNIVAENRSFPSLKEISQMLITFLLVVLGWIIFRSDSIADAFEYIKRLFTFSSWNNLEISLLSNFIYGLFGVVILLIFEWSNRKMDFGLDFRETKLPKIARISIYLVIALLIFYFGGDGQAFIYFQF